MNKHPCLYTIDNGNSNPHIATFKNNQLKVITPRENFIPLENEADAKYIISSVGKEYHFPYNAKEIPIPKLLNNLFLDMPTHYTHSLGEDRLYQSYYLYHNYILNNKRSDLLLIDSGTFTKFDFIKKSGYQGGYIFPGVQTFLESYSRGNNLPLIKIQNKIQTSLGNSTENAIRNATSIYHLSITKRIIEEYRPKEIIITGGSSLFMKEVLNNLKGDLDYKLHVDFFPNLIHESLNYIANKLGH